MNRTASPRLRRPLAARLPRALRRLVPALLLLSACLAARTAGAWGTPHVEITRHALRMLPPEDRLEARLGGARQMEDLAWGGDYQGFVHAQYYVDDFLLFPGFPRHSGHLMPQVAETWRPFFLRTLQALRGESPQNAARWLGAFLHFVQDSGSPPHALPIGGVLHTRMENYVLAYDVRIAGYRPQELPREEEAAAAAAARRLEELVAFSRERAERLRPLAEKNDRLACEPLVLECAQETMRAVADVTHALLVLAQEGPRPATGTLRGALRAPADPDFPQAPAKILLEGTAYGTVADPGPRLPHDPEYRAAFVLGDLPPGEYTAVVLRPGCRTVRRKVRLRAGGETVMDLRLPPDPAPGNRVRNADFAARWLHPGQPDHWRRETPTGGAPEWRSDAFPVFPGGLYLAAARDARGARRVFLRSSDDPRMPPGAPRLEARPGVPVRLPHAYAQLVVEGEAEPAHASVRRAEEAGEAAPARGPTAARLPALDRAAEGCGCGSRGGSDPALGSR